MFKLSFSWSRILPNGFTNHISKDGVRFYKNVLDEIAANGMIPMVALFQMDLPLNLHKMGGLANPLFVDWFEQYARFVFATFGDKVRTRVWQICTYMEFVVTQYYYYIISHIAMTITE